MTQTSITPVKVTFTGAEGYSKEFQASSIQQIISAYLKIPAASRKETNLAEVVRAFLKNNPNCFSESVRVYDFYTTGWALRERALISTLLLDVAAQENNQSDKQAVIDTIIQLIEHGAPIPAYAPPLIGAAKNIHRFFCPNEEDTATAFSEDLFTYAIKSDEPKLASALIKRDAENLPKRGVADNHKMTGLHLRIFYASDYDTSLDKACIKAAQAAGTKKEEWINVIKEACKVIKNHKVKDHYHSETTILHPSKMFNIEKRTKAECLVYAEGVGYDVLLKDPNLDKLVAKANLCELCKSANLDYTREDALKLYARAEACRLGRKYTVFDDNQQKINALKQATTPSAIYEALNIRRDQKIYNTLEYFGLEKFSTPLFHWDFTKTDSAKKLPFTLAEGQTLSWKPEGTNYVETGSLLPTPKK